MDPLLVITNSDAGPADEESLQTALTVLRSHTVGRGAGDVQPGRAEQRAAPRRVRAGSSSRAATAACTRWSPRSTGATTSRTPCSASCPLGTGNDFARDQRDPARRRGGRRRSSSTACPEPMDLVVDEVGEIVVNNVHAGAGAQASRRGAKWKDRLHAVGVGKVNLGKLGYPIGARLGRGQAAVHPGPGRGGRRGGRRPRPADPHGRGRQRRQRRRRHRADPARRPRRRHGRRDGLPVDRAVGPARVRRQAGQSAGTRSATT